MGYLVSPYSYANGSPSGLPVTMVRYVQVKTYANDKSLAKPKI